MTNETILPEHTQKGDMRLKDGKLWMCTDPDINRWVCPDDRGWQLVPEVQALKRDKDRLDWLACTKNNIGNVQLPKACVERNPHSLRDAIDDAMEYKK